MLSLKRFPVSIENGTTLENTRTNLSSNNTSNTTSSLLNDVITPIDDVITKFMNNDSSAFNSTHNSTFRAKIDSLHNNSTPIVDKNFDDVTNIFSIQEQVVIGAATTVGMLAIIAIVLRVLMPMFQKKKKVETHQQYHEDLYDAKSKEESPSFVPYIHILPLDSDQSQSSTLSEWSDSSSNQTKSTYYISDSKQPSIWKTTSFGNLRGSTLSLPVSLPNDGSVLSRSCSFERLNQSLMSVLSQKSMQFRETDAEKLADDSDIDPCSSDDVTGSISSMKTTQTVTSSIEKEDIGPMCEQSYNNKYKN